MPAPAIAGHAEATRLHARRGEVFVLLLRHLVHRPVSDQPLLLRPTDVGERSANEVREGHVADHQLTIAPLGDSLPAPGSFGFQLLFERRTFHRFLCSA